MAVPSLGGPSSVAFGKEVAPGPLWCFSFVFFRSLHLFHLRQCGAGHDATAKFRIGLRHRKDVRRWVTTFRLHAYFRLFTTVNVSEDGVSFVLVRRVREGFFFKAFVVNRHPRRPFLPFAANRHCIFTKDTVRCFHVIRCDLRILGPFRFQFSIVRQQFIVPRSDLRQAMRRRQYYRLINVDHFRPFIRVASHVINYAICRTDRKGHSVVDYVKGLFISTGAFLDRWVQVDAART